MKRTLLTKLGFNPQKLYAIIFDMMVIQDIRRETDNTDIHKSINEITDITEQVNSDLFDALDDKLSNLSNDDYLNHFDDLIDEINHLKTLNKVDLYCHGYTDESLESLVKMIPLLNKLKSQLTKNPIVKTSKNTNNE